MDSSVTGKGEGGLGKKVAMNQLPDTRLPQSCAGGQGPYLRSVDYLGRSSEAKDRNNPEQVMFDGRTDGPTKRGVE